jgi:hypothetical protein
LPPNIFIYNVATQHSRAGVFGGGSYDFNFVSSCVDTQQSIPGHVLPRGDALVFAFNWFQAPGPSLPLSEDLDNFFSQITTNKNNNTIGTKIMTFKLLYKSGFTSAILNPQ